MSSRKEYWRTHLERIETEGIAIKTYAGREGLSVGSLYKWRHKLDRTPREAKAIVGRFVAVAAAGGVEPHVACRLSVGERMEIDLSALPSPTWLAAVWAALSASASNQ